MGKGGLSEFHLCKPPPCGGPFFLVFKKTDWFYQMPKSSSSESFKLVCRTKEIMREPSKQCRFQEKIHGGIKVIKEQPFQWVVLCDQTCWLRSFGKIWRRSFFPYINRNGAWRTRAVKVFWQTFWEFFLCSSLKTGKFHFVLCGFPKWKEYPLPLVSICKSKKGDCILGFEWESVNCVVTKLKALIPSWERFSW